MGKKEKFKEADNPNDRYKSIIEKYEGSIQSRVYISIIAGIFMIMIVGLGYLIFKGLF